MSNIGNFMLFEGGNALRFSRDILSHEVSSTFDDVRRALCRLGYNEDQLVRVGSAGERETSADLDVCIVGADLRELHDRVRSGLGHLESRLMAGVGVVSVGFPISGDPHGYVQVDLIPVVDMAWCDFVFGRPHGSSYKSAHRNWLVSAALGELDERLDSDRLRGYSFRLGSGVYLVERTFRGKRKERLKRPIKLHEEFFSADPHVLMSLAFGPDIRPADVQTFEQTVDVVLSTMPADRAARVFERCCGMLERAKLNVPEPLTKLVGELRVKRT